MSPVVCFNIFALLIASRDVLSQVLLSEKMDPIFLLAVYCWTTTIVAFLLNLILRRASIAKSISQIFAAQPWNRSTGRTVIALGALTLLSSLGTLFGIKAIGAPTFSLILHSLMPVSTAIIAGKMFGDQISRAMRRTLFSCLIGILFFMGPPAFATLESAGTQSTWILLVGMTLAVLSSVLMSLTLAQQKLLVSGNFFPDEVLFLRFFIPSILLLLVVPFMKFPDFSVSLVMRLIAIALFSFTLPLIFLCMGFLKSSLVRFSAYLLLIPAYTFFLGLLLAAR
jgi:drug/metabolite transporter (DMT)-like permease